MNILPKKVENKIQFLATPMWWVGSKKYSAALSLARVLSKQVNLLVAIQLNKSTTTASAAAQTSQGSNKHRQQLRKVALRHLIHLHWKIFLNRNEGGSTFFVLKNR